jgi:thiol-disulfide isomerase/thioredoxin
MQLHPKQKDIASSDARFKIIRAGRRSGKSTVEVETMLYKAVTGKDRTVFYIAPTQIQARSIIWEALKKRVAGIGEASEQRLEMKVPTQDGGFSVIKVAGWENRENFRGQSAHHITFDELDTMKDFFIGWQEIFRPALIDTGGSADFIGTPKKENPNLRRLEKEAEKEENKYDWQSFHFTSLDNPNLPVTELIKAKEELDSSTYRQEILAEYVDNLGSLFKYSALVDMFSNTISKTNEKYLIVDVADDGTDKTVFSFWQGLEMYRLERFERLNTEGIINQIREYAAQERIPYSQIAVDAIGVGAAVGSSSLLDGILAFKSSHQAIRTDIDPVRLPNVHYTKDAPLITEYKNLRSQCMFTLALLVNEHKIAVKIPDVRIKEHIIEELAAYQDVSPGDGKRMATMKEDIKALIGRSPDLSDTLVMRMYFEIRSKLAPYQSEERARVHNEIINQFERNTFRQSQNSSR